MSPKSISEPMPLRRYFEVLRNQVFKDYRGKLRDVLLRIPDLVRLFTNLLEVNMLLDYEKLSSKDKILINAAIGYLIAPTDVMPEARIDIGESYEDDAFACLYVLDKLIDSLGEEIIRENWEGTGDIIKLAAELLEKTKDNMDKEIRKEVLLYMGLENFE